MSAPAPVWPIRRFRDLILLDAPDGGHVVIACDSIGGIGPKPSDTFHTEARTVMHFGARVPLLEVIAAGATPQVIVDTLSVERHPTGEEMIHEIRAMAAELGLDPDVAVTGSTEDNVPTVATAFGVTVVGIAPAGSLRVGTTLAGDTIVCLGIPLSAPRDLLVPGDPRMPSIREVAQICTLAGVHEVLPVGSRGIAYEVSELMRTSGLTAEMHPTDLDLAHTAGPSTCVLVSATAEAVRALQELRADLPVAVLAHAQG